jgi:hypothetical protein
LIFIFDFYINDKSDVMLEKQKTFKQKIKGLFNEVVSSRRSTNTLNNHIRSNSSIPKTPINTVFHTNNNHAHNNPKSCKV